MYFTQMQATLTELRRKTSEVLRSVQAGKGVEITDHGQVIAELRPRFKGMSGAEFARLWRSGPRLDREVATEVLANVRATEAAE
jgi:antitoxin (DNA-binding transcriptional repressor) of toxin-antitoxin stability system